MPKNSPANNITAKNETWIGTSETPKNAHLNPEMRYIAGLNILTTCQADGSISME